MSKFKTIKTVKGPNIFQKNGPAESVSKELEFTVYDLNYYTEELDIFEWWYMGELQFGTLNMNREFLECDDRLSKTEHSDKQFFYFTRMVDTKFTDSDRLATVALIHGFSEN